MRDCRLEDRWLEDCDLGGRCTGSMIDDWKIGDWRVKLIEVLTTTRRVLQRLTTAAADIKHAKYRERQEEYIRSELIETIRSRTQ